ncbi:MAG: NAD-binding oxidoreductase, partial [Pseudomonadota bacterium]
MGIRFLSTKNRAPHLGPYPLEKLRRSHTQPDLNAVPPTDSLNFHNLETPHSLVNAMSDYQAMMDVIRAGDVNPEPATVPTDPTERAQHLKAFAYFQDASMVGICRLTQDAVLDVPTLNRDIDRLSNDLRTRQTKSLASGIDEIMAGLRESVERPQTSIKNHTYALVILDEYMRSPRAQERGAEWIMSAQAHRSALRTTETAIILSNYLATLGFEAKAHTATSADVDANRLAAAAGLATMEDGSLCAPWLGTAFGLAVVTTNMDLTPDQPLAPWAEQPWNLTHGPGWQLGGRTVKNGLNRDPYAKRDYVMGAHPFETLRRVDRPTTFIDEERVARVPKRADMFARAQFGDMGKKNQKNALGGYYVRKSAPANAQRRALGAFLLLQDGAPETRKTPQSDAQRNAENVKAAAYFLGVDAVGISRCPDWTWYSHDAT